MKTSSSSSSSASASVKAWPRPHGAAPGDGAVRVSVLVPASASDAWSALTERDIVARWFGDLSESLKPGGTHRLDFGDGDFFAITDVTLDPPRSLAYCWRFLGTSPTDAISWSIESDGIECRVTVTDVEPNRTRSGCDQMIEGWTDFLQRLQDYFITGRNTRYAWRKEFSGSIELAVEPARAFDELFSAEGRRSWLPWAADRIEPGTSVTMTDDRTPARLMIGTVNPNGNLGLRFQITCGQWRAATEVAVTIEPWPSGALLIISHTGWQAISSRESEQATQRARFGALWTQALRIAQHFVSR